MGGNLVGRNHPAPRYPFQLAFDRLKFASREGRCITLLLARSGGILDEMSGQRCTTKMSVAPHMPLFHPPRTCRPSEPTFEEGTHLRAPGQTNGIFVGISTGHVYDGRSAPSKYPHVCVYLQYGFATSYSLATTLTEALPANVPPDCVWQTSKRARLGRPSSEKVGRWTRMAHLYTT